MLSIYLFYSFFNTSQSSASIGSSMDKLVCEAKQTKQWQQKM